MRGRSTISTASGRRPRSSSGSACTTGRRRCWVRGSMPGARLVPGATLNYAEHALTPAPGAPDDDVAVLFAREDGLRRTVTHAELRDAGRPGPGRAASGWASAAGTASSRWPRTAPRRSSRSSPRPASARSGRRARRTSAPRAVHDRFAQIEPAVLFAVDGYRYGGKRFDIRATVAGAAAQLPSLRATVLVAATSDAGATAGRRDAELGGVHAPSRRAAAVRAGAVRPPAVGAVLLGHHRPAEGHRARPRRHRAGAPEVAARCTSTSGPATGSSGSPPPAG